MDRVGDRSLVWAELRSCRARRRRGGGDVDCLDVGIVVVEVVESVEPGEIRAWSVENDDEVGEAGVPTTTKNAISDIIDRQHE